MAARVFRLAETMELAFLPLFMVAVWEKSILAFCIILVIDGVVNEVGKSALPPILKTLAGDDSKRLPSFSRTNYLVSRFLGTLGGGLSYVIVGAWSFPILSAFVAVSVVASLSLPSDVSAVSGEQFTKSLKSAWASFRNGRLMRYAVVFGIDNFLGAVASILLVTLVLNVLHINSFLYGIMFATMFATSSFGTLLMVKLNADKRKMVVATLALPALVMLGLGFAQSFLLVYALGATVGLVGAVGRTILIQVLYEDSSAGSIALSNQIFQVSTALANIIGAFSGGILGILMSPRLGLVFLAPAYSANALLSYFTLKDERKQQQEQLI